MGSLSKIVSLILVDFFLVEMYPYKKHRLATDKNI